MSKLMSPRKVAAGAASGGNFGVGDIAKPMAHPDRNMNTGAPMADNGRATPPTIARGAGQMGMEANSDHGPHNHKARR